MKLEKRRASQEWLIHEGTTSCRSILNLQCQTPSHRSYVFILCLLGGRQGTTNTATLSWGDTKVVRFILLVLLYGKWIQDCIRFIKPHEIHPALVGVSVHLHKAVYKLHLSKQKSATTNDFPSVHTESIYGSLNRLGEAVTRSGPPPEPDVFLSEPLSELLMLLLQHWRLRTNKPQTAKINQSNKLWPETLSALKVKQTRHAQKFSSPTSITSNMTE